MTVTKQSGRDAARAERKDAGQAGRRQLSGSSKIKAEIETLKKKIERELAELLVQADRMMPKK